MACCARELEHTLEEVFRMQRPGGELCVADRCQPHNLLMYLVSLVMRHLEEASHSIAGFLPEMYRDIGLVHIEERAKYVTLFGTLSIIRALKPLADEGARYRSRGPEKR